jgi:hypothetical protein
MKIICSCFIDIAHLDILSMLIKPLSEEKEIRKEGC